MEVILSQFIRLKTTSNGWTTVTKSFESNVIPREGDIVEDSVWKVDNNPKVLKVTINYSENYCYVELEPVVLESEDSAMIAEYARMAKSHGWGSPSDRLALNNYSLSINTVGCPLAVFYNLVKYYHHFVG